MPTLLESCEKYYGSRNLYVVLKISKTASDSDVKKAYKKLSLLVHPDRVSEEEKTLATEKFKILGKIHSIITDEEKRKIYDETGSVEEEDIDYNDRDWTAYWRLLFKEITVEDIEKYEKKYKGSEEEIEDVKEAYEKGKGDMDIIFDSVPFTTLTEEPRIRKILEDLIEEGELKAYDEFVNESKNKKQKRKRRLEKEAKEAEKARKELEKKKTKKMEEEELVEGDLVQAILQKKKDRADQAESFLNHLAAKYSKPKKAGKKK